MKEFMLWENREFEMFARESETMWNQLMFQISSETQNASVILQVYKPYGEPESNFQWPESDL